MAGLVERAVACVEEMRGEITAMCRALVRINTVNPYAGGGQTGSELAGQAFIKPILEEAGGAARLFEPPPDIYHRMGVLGPADRNWEGRPNLVTEFDFGPGPRIIINSHMDTVGVEGMASDPFCGGIRNGRIYGRGSSDDKGGMVMGIAAVKAAARFAGELGGSVVHQSVVDEECSGGGAGTLACCLEGYTGDEAIVIDGQGLAITRGCQGVLTAGLTVHGRGGHAATGGVNAIDKAVHVKQAIDRFKQARETQNPDWLVNLGVFRSGVHAAVVPDSARLSLNIVYGIEEAARNEAAGSGWNGTAIRAAFEHVVRGADRSDPFLSAHPTELVWDKDLVPFETPEDAPVVRHLAAAYEAVLDREAGARIMPAWADAANLARYGSIPSVLFGCGTEGKAHSQDEYVVIEDIITGAKVVAAYLVQRLRSR